MKADYLSGLIKDLKALRGTMAFARIQKLAFEDARAVGQPDGIAGLKVCAVPAVLTGFGLATTASAFSQTDRRLTFARALHRKEIYRFYP